MINPKSTSARYFLHFIGTAGTPLFIRKAEGARITLTDLAGDNDHWSAEIVSEQFRGRTRVAQHQLVYAALKGRMGGALHALALTTRAPD